MISLNRSLIAFNLIWLWEQVERVPAAVRQLAAYSSHPPHVGLRVPFEHAPEAMRALQSGSTVGKVVLEL
ncbi:MAG: hypothetical protein AMJ58_11315 [Gammaproteobacteria bacterium SG8_30]|nr:MAG: hypothetical protein AMJ58_11315 [Gammaproteobacteria bacterium SG8_30]